MSTKIEIDGKTYDISNASATVKTHIANIQYVNELISQRWNELNVADTAKLQYAGALRLEIESSIHEWDF